MGKYRKTCLPRGEVTAGIAPGHEYPVFDTRFGKLGMMVCYDGFFPEVARELANRGAEVIAWPVWGCNPSLASARACENHVYLVSSTYEDISHNWMLTAIYGHDGQPLVQAEKWGTIIVTEVDLDQRCNGTASATSKPSYPGTGHQEIPIDTRTNHPAGPPGITGVERLATRLLDVSSAASGENKVICRPESPALASICWSDGGRTPWKWGPGGDSSGDRLLGSFRANPRLPIELSLEPQSNKQISIIKSLEPRPTNATIGINVNCYWKIIYVQKKATKDFSRKPKNVAFRNLFGLCGKCCTQLDARRRRKLTRASEPTPHDPSGQYRDDSPALMEV